MKTMNNNMHRLVIYLYNPVRKGSTTGRGSKDFRTTRTFKGIETYEEALIIINQFAESKIDGPSYSPIKKAYYNGKLLISDGKWVKNK